MRDAMSADVEAAGREAERKVVGPWPPILAGLLAAVVGYGSSFAIVLQGLIGVGATPAQAESGLLALGTMMGLAAIVFGLRTRMPIAIAWSTPGAALLAATGAIEGGFAAAVGAFIVAGALVVLAGLWKPLGRAVLAIPAPLANAMLAGVLLSFCIAPVKAVAEVPMMALPAVIGWVIVTRFARLYAAPAAVVIAAFLWGLAIIGMGLAPNLWLAVAFLALAGAADSVSGIFRSIIWNETIPNEKRGKLAGMEMISYMSGPLMGNMRAGWMAGFGGVAFSVAAGGALCVAGVAACGFALPAFWRYRGKERAL